MKNTKIALVTGGGSGIGFATAKLLCQRDYNVFIVGRNLDATKKSASDLDCEYIIADLSDTTKLDNISEKFCNTGLDILVNCAAIGYLSPIEMIDTSVIQDHFSTNLFSPLILIKKLIPALEKRQGSITNVSSLITTRHIAGFSLYAATKSALESITKTLALELAPRNICINAVCPGVVDTPFLGKMKLPDDMIQKFQEEMLASIPMKRVGTAMEIAQVIYAQLESRYVTGSIWHIDGGQGVL